jgi:hypothetical protein
MSLRRLSGFFLVTVCSFACVSGFVGSENSTAFGQGNKNKPPKKPEPPVHIPERKISLAPVKPNTRSRATKSDGVG